MTREELSNRHFIFTKINEQNEEEITAVIDGSLLIPKPKFKVGDRVRWILWSDAPEGIIEERLYNPDANMWGYLRSDMETYIDETDLELVENKEDGKQ